MRKVNLILLFLLGYFVAFAQPPSNDDCTNVIDLGDAPVCPDDIFTNVDATASPIWPGTEPVCFNGGTAQNDVWFTFSTTNDPLDLSIFLEGVTTGANGSIMNPQMAIYRGDCAPGDFAFFDCVSSAPGETSTSINLEGLTPFTTYFIRVNDYSASALPNWGDFQLCIEEYVGEFVMGGETDFTTGCAGTLYDSGGPEEDYTNNENHTFTVCPDNNPQCIAINVSQFNIEAGFDDLTIYAGNSTAAPVAAILSGAGIGGTPVFVDGNCATFEFNSDGGVVGSGFELTWECSPSACDYPEIGDATIIPSLPYSNDDLSNCDSPLSVFDTPCADDDFLNGPKYYFQYTSTGLTECHQVVINGAPAGTGIAIIDGLPDDPDTECVQVSTAGSVSGNLFQEAGTYYIIVAHPTQCIEFDIEINEADCPLALGLTDALCNPLNACIDDPNFPSTFFFQQGIQDLDIIPDQNAGCWGGVGTQADFFWFSIEIQADGPFGFILESAGTPSDIDFNVWGPFDKDVVCENQDSIAQYIQDNEPTRSSYAGGTEPTGLADVNPLTGDPAIDEWDCNGDNDDIVQPYDALEGEVYVVLVNDWGDLILDEGISVDWGPSDPDVLFDNPLAQSLIDTAVCIGQSVLLEAGEGIEVLEWIDETGTLSCTDCPTPIATVEATTSYGLVYNTLCGVDTVDVKINIIEGGAVGDTTLCIGEFADIEAGSEYPFVDYSWTADSSIDFSCDDCPNPSVAGMQAGTYMLTVTGSTANCDFTDEVQLIILDEAEPTYTIADDTEICASDGAQIGGPQVGVANYSWTSTPEGFTSDEANPFVMPEQTTTYYLEISGNLCPIVKYDTVTISVLQDSMPNLDLMAVPAEDVYCQGDTIILLSTPYPVGLYTYLSHEWLNGPGFESDTDLWNMVITAEETYTYQRVTFNGMCADTSEITITVEEPLPFEVLPASSDICEGNSLDLMATVPDGTELIWSPGDSSMSCDDCPTPTVTPTQSTVYTATVDGECPTSASAIVNVVDSPIALTLTVDPASVFVGNPITLTATATPASTGTYMWYLNGELIGESTEPTFTYTPLNSFADGVVPCSVTFVDEEFCNAYAETSVEILPADLDIPNTFTPNGDGINDIFKVYKNDGVKIDAMRIYSRWGELVYEGQGDSALWDGSYKGKPSPNDVYIYYIELGNGDVKEGEINLLR